MEGAARAAKRQFDRDISHAWHTAGFSGAAQAGKLKRLDKYLSNGKPKRAQTPAEMLDALRALRDMGAPMSIRQVN